jgi:hypothetical protein
VEEAKAHVQRLISVVKMATVLEGVLPKSSVFLRANWLNAEDSHKGLFPVYGGKCLSRKVVRNWLEKFSQGRSKVADDARPGGEVAETIVKRPLCCVF